MIAFRQFRWRAIAAALVAAATVSAAAIRTPLSPEVERAARTITEGDLSEHVRVLAADDMDGRGLETPGNRRAAEYVADAFRRCRRPRGPGRSTGVAGIGGVLSELRTV